MAGNDDVNVRFGADTGDIESGAQRAADAVGNATNEMTRAAAAGAALGGVLGEVMLRAIETVTEALGDMVAGIVPAAQEMEAFAQKLGVGTVEATGLREALEEVGVRTGEYEQVINRLMMRLRTNEEAFTRQKIAVKDANGQYLDSQTILENTLRRMQEFKAGTDQNLFAQEMMGRRVGDVTGLLRLNREAIDEATQGAINLGQAITQADRDAMHAFVKSAANVGDALQGIGLIISRTLVPKLTELMDYIASKGESTVFGFKKVWTELNIALEWTVTSIGNMTLAISTLWDSMTKAGAGITAAFDAIMSGGGIAGAKSALANAGNDIAAAWRAATAEMNRARAADAAAAAEARAGVWPGQDATGAPIGGNKAYSGPPGKAGGGGRGGKGEDLMATFRQQLQEMRDATGLFRTLELSEEVKFWEAKAELVKGMPKVEEKVNHELAATRRKMAAEELTEALKTLDAQKELYADNKEAVVQIEKAKQALIGATVGEGTARYIEAERQVTRAERAEAQDRVRIAEQEIAQKKTLRMAEISDEEAQVAFMRSINAINNQEEIIERRRIEAEKYSAARDAMLAQRDLDNQTTEQKRKLDQGLETLEVEHLNRVKELDRQAAQERVTFWSTFLDPIQNVFSTSIDAIIRGTTTLSQVFKNMIQNIALSFASLGVQMLFTWIKTQIGMSAIQQSSEATRAAAESASAAAGVAINAAANVAKVTSLAAVAAAAAFASTAAIPIIGPELAPAAAAAAYASTIAWAPVAAAEGGWWDVPGNQAALLHKREMVLPADIADSLRNLVGSGGQTAQVGGAINVHINAVDAQSVRKLFMREGSGLMSSIRSQVRNFNTRTVY